MAGETVVTRLSIDRLRALKTEREAYVGWWLPEPLVQTHPDGDAQHHNTPESAAELAGELSVAFMYVLERLGPEERAAFLLRQVFDYDYSEIAAQLDKSEATCRQMVHRASERVQLQAVFSEAEISDLSFAIAVINAWNLINAGMRAPIPETPVA